jgi:deferrochelatase/peroxidase EfeB
VAGAGDRQQPLTARSVGRSSETPDHTGSDVLTEPLALRGRKPSDVPLLAALQPNILRPHVRESLRLLLIRIEDAAAARAGLARIAGNPDLMKSAADHFDEVDAHRSSRAYGSAFVGIALSRSGYDRLGVNRDRQPGDLAFRAGMSARADVLRDPDPRGWDYPQPVDMIVLVGSHDVEVTARRLRLIFAELDGIRIVADETGMTLRNEHDVAIEHFGYVDGRSQPLFVWEDAQRERELTDGTSAWDPLVALDRVLVRDPGVPDAASAFGSYLIYRKLAQNVQAFDANERRVASLLGLKKEDAERAGAMLVGRFEDGTPVAIQSAEGSSSPVPNNFTYADDERGTKCPHFAHIRMMNTRSADPHHRVVIARRGQTYGARPDIGRPDARVPSEGVGLLFMAVVSEIHSQFEALQQAANGDQMRARDPVIGQGPVGGAPMEFPLGWAGSERRSLPDAVTQAVRMRGGGYFFLPSLTFLRRLGGGS